MTELTTITCFVEDLLVMRKIREGSLSIAHEVFDPNESLKTIIEIFKPYALAKNVQVFLEIGKKLIMPNQIS